ncbi:MAG: lipid II flippase MurJ, partial [Bowdeniella nasicola]|nr:lipid II flippase MurJ [Bowdeniella nasicola]
RIRLLWSFPSGVARRVIKLAGAGVSVLLAQQLSVVALLWLAPYGGDAGTLSLWQLSQAVYQLPYAIGVVPIVTATYPTIAAAVAQCDTARWQALIARSTRLVAAVAATGVVLVIAIAPTIPLLFRADGQMTPAVVALAPALIGMSLIYHFTRILYALDQAGPAVIAGTIGWTIVALSAAVFVVMSASAERAQSAATLTSFGIAHTLGLSIAAVILIRAVAKVAGRDALRGVASRVAVTTTTAVIAGMVGRAVVNTLIDTSMWSGLLAAVAGGTSVLIIVAISVFVTERSSLGVKLQ